MLRSTSLLCAGCGDAGVECASGVRRLVNYS